MLIVPVPYVLPIGTGSPGVRNQTVYTGSPGVLTTRAPGVRPDVSVVTGEPGVHRVTTPRPRVTPSYSPGLHTPTAYTGRPGLKTTPGAVSTAIWQDITSSSYFYPSSLTLQILYIYVCMCVCVCHQVSLPFCLLACRSFGHLNTP